MIKVLGFLSMLIGLVVGIYNYFFRTANIAKSAVLQLEDSDVTYGIGAALANSNSSAILTIISSALIIFGLYCFFKKQINKHIKELEA